jgi:hypothetical protein
MSERAPAPDHIVEEAMRAMRQFIAEGELPEFEPFAPQEIALRGRHAARGVPRGRGRWVGLLPR